MHISILLMEQIAELFLMILMGYIIVKTGLLKGDDSKVISKIVLYLVIPCVIINAFQVDYTSEKVKELLFYGQMSLSEIAHDMNYSSVAHLSSQFKKETGMTPTQFKSQENPNRKSLDDLQS